MKFEEAKQYLATKEDEDNLLLRLMAEAAKSGTAPRKRVLSKLGIK